MRCFLLLIAAWAAGCLSTETQERLDQAEKRHQELEKKADEQAARLQDLLLQSPGTPAPSDEQLAKIEQAKSAAADAKRLAEAAKAELDAVKTQAREERWDSGARFAEIGLEAAAPLAMAFFPALAPILSALGRAAGGLRRKESLGTT